MGYIDTEKIKYHKLAVCGGHGLNFEYTVAYKHEVDAIFPADVVPRAEFEKAYLQFEETSGLKQAKAEVAREIFEEIESIIRKHDERPKYQLMLDLAQLKKKYTESDSDENKIS